MSGTENAYELHQVSFAYESEQSVLDGITLSIPSGSWVSLVGPNGCGKSTLAKLLGGLLAANAGEVVVEGTVLNRETIHQIRPRIGMVFQNPDNQFIGSTVEEDIAFGLEGRCLPREEMIHRVRKYGDKLEIGHLLSKHPSELSGGQKQRVAVAAILAMEPGIVIFDEASSMLDEKARGELLDIIKEMKQSGEYTIVSITHDAEEIMYSDRAIVLLDGGVAADLSPEDLFHDDALLQSCRLIAPYRIQLVRELAKLGVQVPPLQREEEVTEALWQLHLNK
ncbi:energy-coupling factor transport system ATP-binding protein [Fontibacillus panacisegetis]|uniref:Energy-coupling factor transport system ATP-binding protein n=1 Tax=Fontibacillus panacisegetis TaxID=670482 RepID=A0A1G7S7N7_9BACL|nr:energy-coupling factor transporter ATPase [Fontibacillus panacisegetis]SDG18954.1 energy-coupling factor transport system ATP-binding protein [Fontibacillus panacisegetis]